MNIPPLIHFWDHPNDVMKYPTPVAQRILDQMKQAVQQAFGSENVPEDPVQMALKHPRYKWMDAKHIRYLGEKVSEIIESCGSLVVTMPPQSAKSTVCSIWTPFWFLAKNPEANIILVGYEKNFARRWGKQVRMLVDHYGKDYGLQIDPDSRAADDWSLTTGGGMSCTGIGGSISGRYVKLVIVDDPIKNWEEAQSEIIRETTWEWWEGTLLQRVQPDTTLICIATRYREDDLIGRILAKSGEDGGRVFTSVSFPAKAETSDELGRIKGQGLWKPQEFYDEKERSLSPYVWASVYQQQPSPPGGNMVDPEWWRYYKPHEVPADFDQEIQSWDLSLDAEKKSDSYHAGLVLSRKGAMIYVRDSFHEHCDINKVISQISSWTLNYPRAKQKLVERATAGPALVQALRGRISGLIAWPPKGRQKGSKEACLNACIPDIRSGNVLLPLVMNKDGSWGKPRWVEEFIEELRQFPRGSHDDWCDSFSQGEMFLMPSAQGAINSDQAEAMRWRPDQSPEEKHTQGLHAMMAKLSSDKVRSMRMKGQVEGIIGTPVIPFPIGGQAVGAGRRRRMW